MEIALTHSGPIPFDDYPDGSLFLCRMCNFEKNPNASHYNGRIFLLRHYKSGDYACPDAISDISTKANTPSEICRN